MTTTMTNTYYQQLELLDPLERELYRILKTFSDNTTKQCFPSIASLSKLFKRCRNTTKKYIRQLEFKGFIHVKQQRVKHKVTNNKYNDTNLYTLLLEKFKKVMAVAESTEDDKVVELKETRLDTIIKELESKHNKESVTSALKAMRKNMRNGSIINNEKKYLETLINKSSNQLEEVNKALESSVKVDNSTSNTKHKANSFKPSANNYNTKFHNFEQRTSNYNADELEAKILANHKRK